MKAVVVDTNVPIVANGRDTHASSACRLIGIDFLEDLVAKGRIAIDDRGVIFEQYKSYLSFSGQPGVGDLFFKHVFDNMYVSERVERVVVEPIADDRRQFAEFPVDAELASFDRADKVFVAVARATPRNRDIVNATDGGWAAHRVPLLRHGVAVVELCPEA